MAEVCVVGHVTRDRIAIGGELSERPGGTAYFSAMALARLGHAVQVVTRVAEADRPVVLSGLERAGVELTVLESPATTAFENRHPAGDPDQREQRVSAVAAPFAVADLAAVDAPFLHLGPLTPGDLPLDVLQAASSCGRVSLDGQGMVRRLVGEKVEPAAWPERDEGLAWVDVLKVDEHEAHVLTGEVDPVRSARALVEMGPDEVVVTCASRGCVVAEGSGASWIDAVPVALPVDPTGCGDTFSAAYLSERLAGRDAAAAARFAAAAAACKLEGPGPLQASRAEIEARLRA